MQVVSSTPFRVATLLWQPVAGSFVLSVLCKATFSLRAGESVLAQDQEGLQKEDAFWGNDPNRSLSRASDLAPQKARVDVVLTGHAYAPNRMPVRQLTARLAVGDVDKSVDVVGQRYYDAAGVLRDGPPFAQMPMVYELAAAGPENPAGIRPGQRDANGVVELPNIVPTGLKTGLRNDVITPIGFGPIASIWPLRMERLGRHGATWDHAKWYRSPLDGIDMGFFNCAPADQQMSALRMDERIVLENLHPEHAVLVTTLPGIRPTASVELPGKAPFALELCADTLAINTATLNFTVVWRAFFPVEDPRADGRVIIGMETGAQKTGAGHKDIMGETALPSTAAPEQALPFHAGMPGAPPSIPSGPASPRPKRSGDTMSIPVYPSTPSAPVSVSVESPVPLGPMSARGPMSSGSAKTGAFPVMSPPTTPPSVPPPPMASPVEAPPDPAPVPLTIGQAMAAAQAGGAEKTPIARGPIPAQPDMLAVPVEDDSGARAAADVAAGGVLAASNAAVPAPPAINPFAAGGAPPAGATDATSTRPLVTGGAELLRLAWFDSDGVPRLRRKPAFRAILDALAKRPPDREADNAQLDETPAEIEDRREVTELLLRADATDSEGVRAAVNEGIRDDGRFVPQVVLVAGELEMAFDALETLKAMLPVAASLATPNDPLSAAVAGATTFLNTPGIPSPIIADALAGRVRNAFLQGKKGKDKAEPLDGPTERVLVEQRLYRRRPVFGDTFVRASMFLAGSQYPIPTYFPEAAAKKLPLQRRYRARLLVETNLAADPTETHSVALRATALAELLPGGKR